MSEEVLLTGIVEKGLPAFNGTGKNGKAWTMHKIKMKLLDTGESVTITSFDDFNPSEIVGQTVEITATLYKDDAKYGKTYSKVNKTEVVIVDAEDVPQPPEEEEEEVEEKPAKKAVKKKAVKKAVKKKAAPANDRESFRSEAVSSVTANLRSAIEVAEELGIEEYTVSDLTLLGDMIGRTTTAIMMDARKS